MSLGSVQRVNVGGMSRTQITEAALMSAPRLHAALQKRFDGKPLVLESCSVTDLDALLQEASSLGPKQARRTKFKFLRDNGSFLNYYLEPSTQVFYRESGGKVFLMWNACYSESTFAVSLAGENCDETFFRTLERNHTGAHESRRHSVRIPTRAGEPCRG